jgi:N-acetylmuramoyl-L-alanine amidase
MKELHNLKYIICIIVILFFYSLEIHGESLQQRFISAKNDLAYISRSKNVSRRSYKLIAEKFHKIYLAQPNSSISDDALFMTAETYYKSYLKFNDKRDLREALKYYRLVAVNFSSDLSAESYLKSANIYVALGDYASAKFMLQRLISKFPDNRNAIVARKRLTEINKRFDTNREHVITSIYTEPKDSNIKPVNQYRPSYVDNEGLVLINNIRYWSSPSYTRIVIDLNKKASYEKQWLVEDIKNKKPARLFIDIKNARVDEGVSREIPIKDGLVSAIRWGYYREGVTRIVLDSQNIMDFTIFDLENPNRIVIDVSGDERQLEVVEKNNLTANTDTLAGVFGLKVKRVVIDAGHGGKDPGASYYNLFEKDITLDIALELKKLFTTQTDLEVILTRDRDIFIPLEERTAIANKRKADIFVSVHINASRNRNTTGVETYVLNVTKDKSALEVAAFENQATEKSLSDLQSILKDIMLNSKLEESKMLAKFVQDNLAAHMGAISLGVKQAPFYVLVGATMPAILVEADFLSSKSVANKYKNIAYRKKVAKGIFDGVLKYINKYNGKK